MSRFVIAFENESQQSTGTTEGGEISGAVLEIEKDIQKDNEISGAEVGDLTSDETQARIEEVLSIESLEEEISTELEDAGRVEEVADGLLDLKQIVERIEQPTETDMALIQTAANMAVAGTEVAAQDILPALENFTDMKVAAEGIGEKANAALASIRESAGVISAKVADYIKKVFGALSYRQKRLAELKDKVSALGNDAKANIVVAGNTWMITDDKDGIKDTATLLKAAKNSVDMYSQYSDAYIKLATDFKGAVVNYYKSDAEGNERTKLVNAWFNDFLGSLIKLKGMHGSQELAKPGYVVYASPAYLGADRLVVSVPDKKVTEDTPRADLRGLVNGSWVDVRSTIGFMNDVKKTVTPERISLTLSKSDLKQLVQLGETQLNNMKKFLDKNYRVAQTWNTLGGGSTGQFGSAHARLIAKGRNTQFTMSMWTKRYGDGLLGLIEKLLMKGVAKAGSAE